MVPYRLAINSYCVLDLLAVFHKTAKLYNVHLRPFKFLLRYHEELKQKFEQLKIQCKKLQSPKDVSQGRDESVQTDSSGKIEAQEDDSSEGQHDKPDNSFSTDLEKRKLLRDHLGALVLFIDNDMDEIFRRRAILDQAGQDEISFEDLYHLFRPGQLVFTNLGEDPKSRRAYRVLHVTGGRPIRDIAGNLGIDNDGAEAGGKLEEDLFGFSPESAGQTQQRLPGTNFKLSPVLVDCVYTDYDGEFYCPKSLRFVFLEYTGFKPIRHLDIFPAQFDHDQNQTCEMLLARGERFVGEHLI